MSQENNDWPQEELVLEEQNVWNTNVNESSWRQESGEVSFRDEELQYKDTNKEDNYLVRRLGFHFISQYEGEKNIFKL